jgi:hypothetical protein
MAQLSYPLKEFTLLSKIPRQNDEFFSQRVIVKDRQELIIGTHNLHACGLTAAPKMCVQLQLSFD